jgi:hypothetical protein
MIWGNSAPEGSELSMDWEPQVTYCCVRDWTIGGLGNISDDPLFTTGPLGDYYLSCEGAGQAYDSPAIDAGSDTSQNLGLDKFTTRTDGGFDKGTVDMGYHYPVYDVKIETSLNGQTFSPGHLFEGFLGVENRGSEVMVDAYVALILPGGTILCFGPDGARYGIFPYASGILMQSGFSAGPLNVFSMTIPDNTPDGSYTYASALVRRGADDFIAVSTSPFVIY